MQARFIVGTLFIVLVGCHRQQTNPGSQPEGNELSGKTETLVAGSKLLQSAVPLRPFDVYLVGFHPLKDDPSTQMEAHHFCKQVNEDFAECVLFDGNTKDSNLHGIEYIISEKMFNTLPVQERKYWHPHNYEILSGELIAPGLPEIAEKQLMNTKLNSYGKTWVLWHTQVGGKPADKLPLGDPRLAWSFNHDGELAPGMLEHRDNALKVDTARIRRQRQVLVSMAHPQAGVDELNSHLKRTIEPIAGAKDVREPRR